MKPRHLALLTLLLAAPVYGGDESPAINNWYALSPSTATVVDHVFNNGLPGQHTDCVLADNIANAPNEYCAFEVPYGPNNSLGLFSYHATLETDETDTSKQFCLVVTMCAEVDGSPGTTNCPAVGANLVRTLSLVGGAGFESQFAQSPSQAPGTVFKGTDATQCVGTDCVNTTIVGRVWRDDTITGCDTPLTAGKITRINLLYIHQ